MASNMAGSFVLYGIYGKQKKKKKSAIKKKKKRKGKQIKKKEQAVLSHFWFQFQTFQYVKTTQQNSSTESS